MASKKDIKISYTESNSDTSENSQLDRVSSVLQGILDDDRKPIISKITKDQIIDTNNEWVPCNLCKSRIFSKYLDSHMKAHAYSSERRISTSSSLKEERSTSIVRLSDKPETSSSSQSSSWSSYTQEVKKPLVQSIEKYKFRNIDNVCIAATASKSNRYSDFTIVFWSDEIIRVNNSTYYGAGWQSNVSSDRQRLQLHVIYDSLEEYYTISCKLLSRSEYSSWDSEDAIPERICTQNELLKEIKRALLFFKINPVKAYRMFRKELNKDFDIDYDDSGKAIIVQSSSCEELSKLLKPKQYGNSSYADRNATSMGHYTGYMGE